MRIKNPFSSTKASQQHTRVPNSLADTNDEGTPLLKKDTFKKVKQAPLSMYDRLMLEEIRFELDAKKQLQPAELATRLNAVHGMLSRFPNHPDASACKGDLEDKLRDFVAPLIEKRDVTSLEWLSKSVTWPVFVEDLDLLNADLQDAKLLKVLRNLQAHSLSYDSIDDVIARDALNAFLDYSKTDHQNPRERQLMFDRIKASTQRIAVDRLEFQFVMEEAQRNLDDQFATAITGKFVESEVY